MSDVDDSKSSLGEVQQAGEPGSPQPQTPKKVTNKLTSDTLDEHRHVHNHSAPPEGSFIKTLIKMGGGGKQVQSNSSYPALATRPVGQWISKIFKERIETFYSKGQYEKYNLQAMIREQVADGEDVIKLHVYHVPDPNHRPSFEEAMKGNFEKTKAKEKFGPAWSTHWFRVDITVPEHMRDHEHIELHWDAKNEGLVWTEDGRPLQGLTGDKERIEWILPKSFHDGKEHTIYIEMACNTMFGNPRNDDIIQPPDPDKEFELKTVELVAVNLEARALRIDVWIIGDAAREFPESSWEQHQALKVCNDIINAFELGDKSSIAKGRQIARQFIGDHVDSEKVYQQGNKDIQVFGIGHCHIDSCWLWPWDETKRKVARSWSNQVDLMNRYPELRFACSQAQQYKWLKELYPYTWDRVKEKVKTGQFLPIGGSWVEHDTNMPSGESLARQFLYGQRFFESHFGERCRTFWLPDTFGYSAQLPQFCRLAGMKRFLTQKLSWNNINKFPHSTFNWVALDGSQVICHMPPTDTYTANAEFGDVKRSIEKHKSMDNDHTSLLVFGKGDGGGGPVWEHIEKLRRCRGMADKVGMLPRVHMGNTVDDFFDQLEEKASTLATWNGELYFELHRGTYTTQAQTKWNNRKSEIMLREIEWLATIATLHDDAFKYPKGTLDKMWMSVLLCQFHDCLPGSSIEMCYDDSDKVYAEVFKLGAKLLKNIYESLGISDAKASVDQSVALNTLSWPRSEIVELSSTEAAIAHGEGQFLALSPIVPNDDKPVVSIKEISKNVFVLWNDQLRVRVEEGCITSIYDLVHLRETIEAGSKANQFTIFKDQPLYWQAWDVEVYHLDTRKELPASDTHISSNEAHRVSLTSTIKISDKSSVKSTISLSAAIQGVQSAVECTAEVEWHETLKFLKVDFPVAIRNTEASYESAFGIVKRPTHYNTSWDMAKFEVCCHRFADLSEYNYGVSIINDSKYGFATIGNVMRLSLLRAPKAPDEHADMGSHTIKWAILPHKGSLSETTLHAAHAFNNPVKLVSSANAASSLTTAKDLNPIKITGDASIILDTVKRGEDDEDLDRADDDISFGIARRKGKSVVLRVYESMGGSSHGFIETSWDVKHAYICNLLEDDETELELTERGTEGLKSFAISLRPFEIVSFRLEM